jgi:hypothetical protein
MVTRSGFIFLNQKKNGKKKLWNAKLEEKKNTTLKLSIFLFIYFFGTT